MKIAQLCVVPVLTGNLAEIKYVDELGETDRGGAKLGSTGLF